MYLVSLVSPISFVFFWRFLLGFPLFTEVGTHQTFDWQAESSNNSWCGWTDFVWIELKLKHHKLEVNFLWLEGASNTSNLLMLKVLFFYKKKTAATLASGVINVFERDISQAEYRVQWYQAKREVCTRWTMTWDWVQIKRALKREADQKSSGFHTNMKVIIYKKRKGKDSQWLFKIDSGNWSSEKTFQFHSLAGFLVFSSCRGSVRSEGCLPTGADQRGFVRIFIKIYSIPEIF